VVEIERCSQYRVSGVESATASTRKTAFITVYGEPESMHTVIVCCVLVNHIHGVGKGFVSRNISILRSTPFSLEVFQTARLALLTIICRYRASLPIKTDSLATPSHFEQVSPARVRSLTSDMAGRAGLTFFQIDRVQHPITRVQHPITREKTCVYRNSQRFVRIFSLLYLHPRIPTDSYPFSWWRSPKCPLVGLSKTTYVCFCKNPAIVTTSTTRDLKERGGQG
jgi:hypothetical protein